MSTIKKSTTIPKDVSTKNDLDFQYLKKLGIDYIESMGGGLWTDYNEHDPGITMLEMLAYAITDLGNRIEIPIQDLLTGKEGSNLSRQFYKASDILMSRPVNALDYRKLFIDIDGVRNCWIMPYDKTVYVDCKNAKLSYQPFPLIPAALKTDFRLKGLNKILVDFADDDPVLIAQTIDSITKRYHANRNLCEDLVEIKAIDKHPISVCAEIEVENNADEDEVHARILFAIRKYFSPAVHFYSLKQMLEKGYRTDEIFDGPFLENGFIDTVELQKAGLRSEVRLSDIMNIVANTKGVKLIRDITIGNCNDEGNNDEEWLICIEKNRRPELCSKSTFSYRKDVIPVSYNKARVEEIYQQLVEEEDAYNALARVDREPVIPEGEYLETNFYTTIQNDFPETYGIGPAGLASALPVARKSQAKQLKAYLLFFDQVLASYFAHLGKIKEVLSIEGNLRETYFTQAVQDIRGFNELVNNYPTNDNATLTENLMGDLDNSVERRNQVLDHLIARFAEKFSEYSFLMKEIYGTVAPELVLHSKEVFLREYVELSSARGTGFNYYHQRDEDLWDTGNVSGAEKRIARLTGMKDYFRRNLSTNSVSIYEYSPSPGVIVYKWRIKNASDVTILSSVRTYPTVELAAQQIYQAVLLVIETSEKAVKHAFDIGGVVNGTIIDNLEVLKSTSNYYFQVIDPTLPSTDPLRIVAKQYTYYADIAVFETILLETIRFMKFDFTEEGIFLVEHILLRPEDTGAADQFLPICADDCKSGCSVDPYSFRVSVVLPGFTQRFGDMDFREFMEELIREELPAHVLPKICWIGNRKGVVPDAQNELLLFQSKYKAYLLSLTDMKPDFGAKLVAFKDILINLNTIYPQGRLYDCSDENFEGKIILGRTKLGTLGIEPINPIE